MRRRTLAVVSEAETRVWDLDATFGGPWKAEEAFTSGYFKISLEFGRMFFDEVRVCSSKYGIIPTDFMIHEPYANRITRSTGRITAAELEEQIREQRIYTFSTVVGLGGYKFASLLGDAFSAFPAVLVRFPFSGLPIGEQQKTMSHALFSGKYVLLGEE